MGKCWTRLSVLWSVSVISYTVVFAVGRTRSDWNNLSIYPIPPYPTYLPIYLSAFLMIQKYKGAAFIWRCFYFPSKLYKVSDLSNKISYWYSLISDIEIKISNILNKISYILRFIVKEIIYNIQDILYRCTIYIKLLYKIFIWGNWDISLSI